MQFLLLRPRDILGGQAAIKKRKHIERWPCPKKNQTVFLAHLATSLCTLFCLETYQTKPKRRRASGRIQFTSGMGRLLWWIRVSSPACPTIGGHFIGYMVKKSTKELRGGNSSIRLLCEIDGATHVAGWAANEWSCHARDGFFVDVEILVLFRAKCFFLFYVVSWTERKTKQKENIVSPLNLVM